MYTRMQVQRVTTPSSPNKWHRPAPSTRATGRFPASPVPSAPPLDLPPERRGTGPTDRDGAIPPENWPTGAASHSTNDSTVSTTLSLPASRNRHVAYQPSPAP